MAAGATKAQKYGKRRRFLDRVETVARNDYFRIERPRGGPIMVFVSNFTFALDMVFGNMSNGETVIECRVKVTNKDTGQYHTFNNWTWCGDDANNGLSEFWSHLLSGPASKSMFCATRLIDAFYERNRAAANPE